LEVDKM